MLKTCLTRVFIVLAALCVTTIISAQQARSISPRELWPEATAQIRDNKLQDAQRTVDELMKAGRFLGIQRFPVYADAAASHALGASANGNKQLADWSINLARQLDRNSPDVEFAAADIAHQRSDWPAVGQALVSGFTKTFSNYRARVLASSDMTLVVCAALTASAIVFGIVLFYKYSRSVAHDFREILAQMFSYSTATVLAWAFLFLPLFLWLGPMWILLYWAVIFYSYAQTRDRVLIIIFLSLMMVIPLALSWSSYRISGVDSPILQAAIGTAENSMNPEPLRRLRELREILPGEAVLPLLIGDLEVQQANEREAATQYRRALQINPKLAAAHLNLGNLYFYEGDFQTANLAFDRAASLKPDLAIAYYNRSVVSGELYKYGEQGRLIEEAKRRDRIGIERLLANPPRQKVVMYYLPVSEAWTIAERIAQSGEAREVYGNHASFDPLQSMRNSLTLGSAGALVLALIVSHFRQKNGVAGQCIKCGRTYCYRCKGSRESATYCTQCIHIYLKRDGVSLDTKKEKLREVQEYQTSSARNKKIFTTVFPGSGQLIDGANVSGFILLLLFFFFVAIAVFVGRLAPLAAPAMTMKMAVRYSAVILAALVFLIASIGVYRERAIG